MRRNGYLAGSLAGLGKTCFGPGLNTFALGAVSYDPGGGGLLAIDSLDGGGWLARDDWPSEVMDYFWHTLEYLKVVLGRKPIPAIIPIVNQNTRISQGARGGGRTRTPCGART